MEDNLIEGLAPTRLVEAALFTAGRPVSVEELVIATGLDDKAVKRAVKALEMEYEEKGDATALEVRQAGDKWAMQLRAAFVEHAKTLAEMEIPKKLLKTLALIAFHQPLLQSDLVDMIGTKTYEHVHELEERGLVRTRPEGVSKRLVTSPSFPEYFGIPATDTVAIRTYLANKVGLTLKAPTGEAPLSSFPEGAATTPEDQASADAQTTDAAGADAPSSDEPEPDGAETAEEEAAAVTIVTTETTA